MLQSEQAKGVETRATWALAVAVTTAVLLMPAIYNRFPFVFPDTSAYLAVAYNDSWPIDRAGFYGLLLSPALLALQPSAGIWLAVIAQCAIISLIALTACRRMLPQAQPIVAAALVIATALLTSLPWHAAQLMPDAFTGALILLLWLTASRNVGETGTPLMWMATGVLALFHYTHLAIIVAGAAAAILVAGFAEVSARELAKRAVAAVLTVGAVLAAHTAVYGIYFDRWQPSPLGGYFLFARMNEDGLVPRWMDRHCGIDAPKPLCDLRPVIPRDSQVLLWKRESPVYQRINDKHGEPESWRWVDMVSQAAVGSLKEEPLAFAANLAPATVEQFIHFKALDDECPDSCRDLKMFEWRPSLIEPVRTSRQLTGELPEQFIRAVTSATATLGLILLLPLFVIAVRRRDFASASLLATISLSMVANAAMAGALSDVHDRYQSRIIWLAPFAALLVTVRWREERAAALR